MTSLELELLTLGQLKKAIKEAIRTGQVAIDEIVEKKKIVTEEYQNSLGSIEKIQEMQVHNL